MLGIDAAFGPVYWKSLGLNAFYEQSFFFIWQTSSKCETEKERQTRNKAWEQVQTLKPDNYGFVAKSFQEIVLQQEPSQK